MLDFYYLFRIYLFILLKNVRNVILVSYMYLMDQPKSVKNFAQTKYLSLSLFFIWYFLNGF